MRLQVWSETIPNLCQSSDSFTPRFASLAGIEKCHAFSCFAPLVLLKRFDQSTRDVVSHSSVHRTHREIFPLFAGSSSQIREYLPLRGKFSSILLFSLFKYQFSIFNTSDHSQTKTMTITASIQKHCWYFAHWNNGQLHKSCKSWMKVLMFDWETNVNWQTTKEQISTSWSVLLKRLVIFDCLSW